MVIPEWITYLSDKDPSSVKFFDETGFNCQIVDIETTVTLLLGNILLTCNVTYHPPTLLSQFFWLVLIELSTQILFKVRQTLLNVKFDTGQG